MNSWWKRPRLNGCVIAAGLTLAAGAAAQTASREEPEPRLRRVDQAVEDVGPLSRSLRAVEFRHEARQPTGFSQVYALPDGSRYYRFDGALAASFPQSVYSQTRDGLIPVAPAGTVFYIGAPPELEAADGSGAGGGATGARPPLLSTRLSLRLEPEVPEAPWPRRRNDPEAAGNATADGRRGPRVPTVWSSDSYRRTRLAALLREAATVAPAGPDDPDGPDER